MSEDSKRTELVKLPGPKGCRQGFAAKKKCCYCGQKPTERPQRPVPPQRHGKTVVGCVCGLADAAESIAEKTLPEFFSGIDLPGATQSLESITYPYISTVVAAYAAAA